jgi:hypothetical protein
MITYASSEQIFLRDVAMHQMSVLRDDGVNRHIRFKTPGSSSMYFDLITWPGFLCYTGDMGTYVFHRLEDMFQFFRTDRDHMSLRDGATLAINLSYWAEKLEAVDRCDGVQEYSPAKFRAAIEDWLNQNDTTQELRDAVEDEVLAYADSSEDDAKGSAIGFEFENDYPFEGFWEVNCKEYVFRFVWCCYALAWGIQKYDDAKGSST